VPVNELAIAAWPGHALHAAALKGHTEIVEALLQAGANLNVVTSNGTTLLMYAVSSGDLAIVNVFSSLAPNHFSEPTQCPLLAQSRR